jgi:hypothetical protein
MRIPSFLLIALLTVVPASAQISLNVEVFLTCDGKTDNGAVIQAALDSSPRVFLAPMPGSREACITSGLRLHTGQRLAAANEMRIKLADGANAYLLTNDDWGRGNRNIEVSGGIWDANGGRQVATEQWPGFLSRFEACHGLHIHDATFVNARKYAEQISATDDWSVTNLRFDTANDGVHVHGPANRFRIANLGGYTGDNMVSLTIGDYSAYQTTLGSIKDGLIENVNTVSGITPVRLVGKAGYGFERITIRHIGGVVSSGDAVQLIDDPADATSPLMGADMSAILIEDVNAVVPAGRAEVLISATGFHDGVISNLVVNGDAYGVWVQPNTAIRRLDIARVYHQGEYDRPLVEMQGKAAALSISGVESLNTSNVGHWGAVQFAETSSVEILTVRDIVARFAGERGHALQFLGPVQTAQATNVAQTGGVSAVSVWADVPLLLIGNLSTVGSNYGIELHSGSPSSVAVSNVSITGGIAVAADATAQIMLSNLVATDVTYLLAVANAGAAPVLQILGQSRRGRAEGNVYNIPGAAGAVFVPTVIPGQ